MLRNVYTEIKHRGWHDLYPKEHSTFKRKTVKWNDCLLLGQIADRTVIKQGPVYSDNMS